MRQARRFQAHRWDFDKPEPIPVLLEMAVLSLGMLVILFVVTVLLWPVPA